MPTPTRKSPKQSPKNSKSFYYFIGRLNPPHEGHILALRTVVEKAKSDNATALILLGSGPGGLETLDNPIPFELKKQFIERQLSDIDSRYYQIVKMERPASQVSQYIRDGLATAYTATSIQITHVAGGKDEDTTKLAFVMNAAEKTAKEVFPSATVQPSTLAIEPIQTSDVPMSATKVRKSVYRDYLAGKSLADWEYASFYGDMAGEIYEAILKPAKEVSRDELDDYVRTGQLPGAKTKTRRVEPLAKTRRVEPSAKTHSVETLSKTRRGATKRASMRAESPETSAKRTRRVEPEEQTRRVDSPTKTHRVESPTKRTLRSQTRTIMGGTRKRKNGRKTRKQRRIR